MLNPPVVQRKEGARLKRKQLYLAGMVNYNEKLPENEDRERYLKANQLQILDPEDFKESIDDSIEEEKVMNDHVEEKRMWNTVNA